MITPHLTFEVRPLFNAAKPSSVVVLKFSKPENGNHWGVAECEVLNVALKTKNISGVLLIASPRRRIFCSGGNLKHYSSLKTKAQGVLTNRKIRTSLKELGRISVPTVAAVTGDCFGGGVELISCFDRVLATPESAFGLWQRKQGLTWGWGGGARMLQRLSRSRLTQAMLDSRLISSYEAHRIGFVDEIILPAHIEKAAFRWIAKMADLPKAPLSAIKTWSEKSEAALFDKLWGNPEHLEALKRFNRNRT